MHISDILIYVGLAFAIFTAFCSQSASALNAHPKHSEVSSLFPRMNNEPSNAQNEQPQLQEDKCIQAAAQFLCLFPLTSGEMASMKGTSLSGHKGSLFKKYDDIQVNGWHIIIKRLGRKLPGSTPWTQYFEDNRLSGNSDKSTFWSVNFPDPYAVNGREYPRIPGNPSCSFYFNSDAGLVMITESNPPSDMIKAHELFQEEPKLNQPSDIGTLLSMEAGVKKVERLVWRVKDKTTMEMCQSAISSFHRHGENDGVDYHDRLILQRDTEAFMILLGTPAGAWAAWTLLNFKDYWGCRDIGEIEFWFDNGVPNISFEIYTAFRRKKPA